MKYIIEFKDLDGTVLGKVIRAESDNEAEKKYKELEAQMAINPKFKVLGLVRVEMAEKITRILPRAEAPVWSVKQKP